MTGEDLSLYIIEAVLRSADWLSFPKVDKNLSLVMINIYRVNEIMALVFQIMNQY